MGECPGPPSARVLLRLAFGVSAADAAQLSVMETTLALSTGEGPARRSMRMQVSPPTRAGTFPDCAREDGLELKASNGRRWRMTCSGRW